MERRGNPLFKLCPKNCSLCFKFYENLRIWKIDRYFIKPEFPFGIKNMFTVHGLRIHMIKQCRDRRAGG